MINSRAGRLASHAALCLAQVAALAAIALPFDRIRGFPLDDAWIHQVVARTFAATGTLGYVPGMHGSAATSYLWAAMLSANFRWVHGDPVVFALVLNVALHLAASQLLLRLLLRDGDSWVEALALAALATLGGNVLWFALSGMEATLFIFLSCAAVALWHAPADRRGLTAVGSGLALGLLALTRPEAAPLAVVLALRGRAASRGSTDVLRLLAPWTVALLLYFGSNLALTGSAFPSTLEGRRWLWFATSAGDSRLDLAAKFLLAWARRLGESTLATRAPWVLWTSLALALHGGGVVVQRGYRGMLSLGLLALVHAGIYLVLLPSPGHGGRYQPLVPLVYMMLVGVGAQALVASVATLLRRNLAARGAALTLVALLPWGALVASGIEQWRQCHELAVKHIQDTELRVAGMVRALPASARVASFDIGTVGYFGRHDILDLGGLIDPSIVPLLKTGQVWRALRARQIEYLVLPLGYNPSFPDMFNFAFRLCLVDQRAARLELLATVVSPMQVWLPGILSTGHAAPRQGVFRVHFEAQP